MFNVDLRVKSAEKVVKGSPTALMWIILAAVVVVGFLVYQRKPGSDEKSKWPLVEVEAQGKFRLSAQRPNDSKPKPEVPKRE